jgi:putative membrane protein
MNMPSKPLCLTAISLVVVLASGCTAPGTAMQSGIPAPMAMAGAGGTQDRQFVAMAAGNGMYEVRAAHLAMNRATSPQVQRFATMLVDHHTRANAELDALVRSRGGTPPDMLPRDKQAKLERLSSASPDGFDRMFVRVVGIEDHQADVALYERASRDVSDPQLQAFAGRTLPVLRSHLDAARSLDSSMR